MSDQIKTIKDIAKSLNISVATVSRVLNKSGYFSPEVGKKVMDLVQETGFVYNRNARALKNDKTFTIGLMLPDISNPYFSSIALTIEEYFNRIGYALYICNTKSDPELEFKHFNTFIANKVDGVICISQMSKLPNNFMQYNIPIIAIDRFPICNIPITKIMNDDYQTSFEIAELFVKKKCKNIIMISGNYENVIINAELLKRFNGFYDGLKMHNITFSQENLYFVDMSSDDIIFETEALINSLIAEQKEIDGIFATSDQFALGAVYALNNAGVSIPGKVKVASYDNSLYSTICRPAITSVDQNLHLMATTACEKLLTLINSDQKKSNEVIIIPSYLVERESTN